MTLKPARSWYMPIQSSRRGSLNLFAWLTKHVTQVYEAIGRRRLELPGYVYISKVETDTAGISLGSPCYGSLGLGSNEDWVQPRD